MILNTLIVSKNIRMRKGKFIDDTPFLGIKVEHFVTKLIFARALASHCWYGNLEFNPEWSKPEVLEILKKQLHYDGNGGIDTTHWDGATEEFVYYYSKGYDRACEWIDKNYSYLK